MPWYLATAILFGLDHVPHERLFIRVPPRGVLRVVHLVQFSPSVVFPFGLLALLRNMESK
jgi:hypothetical protein